MRIAFISTMSSVAWGGSEELWSQTALALTRAGHQVIACVQSWRQVHPRLRELERAGAGFWFRQPSERTLASRVWHKLKRGTPAQAMTGKAGAWLRDQRPDLVCISMGNSREGLEWLEVCAHLRLRYVIVVHGVYETLWPEDSLADAMARLFLGAAACCFVSHRNWELLEDEIAISLPNAEVVCNPVNLASGAAPAWPPDQPCWRLACVGRLEPHTKAQDLIFKALVDPRWQQRNLKIACYGSGEHFGRGVRRLAERYAPRQIEFHGHVGDVAQIWAANHGLVMPSRCEGMPLALVEAMLCSRMAVVTDVGGHTELVQHGVNGFVAAAPTVALVDQALEESWQCRNRWREMGVAARNSVVTAMPTDPAAVFAQRLIALAHTGRARS